MAENPSRNASKEDENIHKGHRERLKRRFRMTGIETFEDHNIPELLLFFAIPLRDTNPTAHKLISKFGSLNGALEAPFEELTRVEGVGDNAATLLRLVGQISGICAARKPGLSIDRRYDFERIGSYLKNILADSEREQVYAMFFDHRMECLGEMTLHSGNINGAFFAYRKLADALSVYAADFVVLAHNHPGGVHIPSNDDLDTHAQIKKFLADLRVGLIEHYIIAPSGFSGLEHRQRLN
ncbi:MAG: RadC family protein [Clostridia bacterium]|nr:RadC family protein [Clostridia bacterium]